MHEYYKSPAYLILYICLCLPIITAAQEVNQQDESNQILVDVVWLIKHKDDMNVVIVDARSKSEYTEGHIEGAINIPVSLTFNPQLNTDRVANIKHITALFRQVGIRNDHSIVIYDGNSYIDAGRVFWVFEVYGHKKVMLLNGGIDGWVTNSKQQLSQIDTHLESSNYIPSIEPQRLVTKLSMHLAIEDEANVIIDTRSKKEYLGIQSIASRAGHIPKAVNIPWNENFEELNGVRMLKPLSDLKKMYSEFDGDKRIFLYCNKGKQSSLSYTIMRQLGFNAAHYDGSWYEWGNDVALPIEVKNKDMFK